MARKMTEKQLANLEKRKPFTVETALKASQKAVEAKREYRSLQSVAREGITPEDWQEILEVMKRKAKDGNLKAIELLRDSCGDKPTDRVEIAGSQDLEISLKVVD